jgi:hypothetical protein
VPVKLTVWELKTKLNIPNHEPDQTKYCAVYVGTRDEMTGSISDDWILLALWVTTTLITQNHDTTADSHTSSIKCSIVCI